MEHGGSLAFTLNNPVNWVDPDGRFTLKGDSARAFVRELQGTSREEDERRKGDGVDWEKFGRDFIDGTPFIGYSTRGWEKYIQGDYLGSTLDYSMATIELFTLGFSTHIAAGTAGLIQRSVSRLAAKGGNNWVFGTFKSEAKWAGQLSKRGWSSEQITEAVTKGKSFDAVNMVNKTNSATRYVL